MSNRWFGHSGDIGDIIYSLPTIKAKGGGVLYLYDIPSRTAHGMNEAKVDRIRPLLEYQPYIESVLWFEHAADHSLNGFRDHLRNAGEHLADAHLATHGLGWRGRAEAWLEVDRPVHACDVIVQRSARYQNDRFPWGDAVEQYHGRMGFVGFRDEHEDFCRGFGDIPLVDCPDFMSLARVIAGSKLYIGNQSSPLAVAHGLKHPVVMEISPGNAQHHCVFQRMNCIIGWDEKIEWPSL